MNLKNPNQSPEGRKAYRRAYYAEHREEARARANAYYYAHRERMAILNRENYLAHREVRMAYQKKYHAEHREELKAQGRIYYLAHREKRKADQRIYRYGMLNGEFELLLKSQGGVCAICRKADWNGRGPHLDHDHVTGKIRGILCHDCNLALGLLDESIPNAERMIEYINKPQESLPTICTIRAKPPVSQ